MPEEGNITLGPNAAFNATVRWWSAMFDSANAAVHARNSMVRYLRDFVVPYLRSINYFARTEANKLPRHDIETNMRDYAVLFQENLRLAGEAYRGALDAAVDYWLKESDRYTEAVLNSFDGDRKESIEHFAAEKAEIFRKLAIDLPDAIEKIGEEYGFHFDRPEYRLAAQTDRMALYQVLPTEPGAAVNESGKPVIISHPYVLGPNIMAFLPSEKKSYAHAFANAGIPTYVRVIKDIHKNPAVQVMTGENDALDTAEFCRILKEKHGKPVTLSGVCQGGFLLLIDVLTGKLDGLVDALITNASPIDGTRSKGLIDYLARFSPRFHDLSYSAKRLPNGNTVVDGEVMAWVYKLKSIGEESPVAIFFRDLKLVEGHVNKGKKEISKTAAAINRWLIYDRVDLPMEITRLSKLSYTVPITDDGYLPFELFGRKLNVKALEEKGIPLLICYGAQDELVEPPSALAPQDFIRVETTEFPKGHAAIFTSWTHPDSDYALHKVHPNGQRGPVKYQLDLDADLNGRESIPQVSPGT